jgi:hypothetical protein
LASFKGNHHCSSKRKLRLRYRSFLFDENICRRNTYIDNLYSGIQKDDVPEISDAKNLEFVHEYKGHNNNWSAEFIVYKMGYRQHFNENIR